MEGRTITVVAPAVGPLHVVIIAWGVRRYVCLVCHKHLLWWCVIPSVWLFSTVFTSETYAAVTGRHAWTHLSVLFSSCCWVLGSARTLESWWLSNYIQLVEIWVAASYHFEQLQLSFLLLSSLSSWSYFSRILQIQTLSTLTYQCFFLTNNIIANSIYEVKIVRKSLLLTQDKPIKLHLIESPSDPFTQYRFQVISALTWVYSQDRDIFW